MEVVESASTLSAGSDGDEIADMDDASTASAAVTADTAADADEEDEVAPRRKRHSPLNPETAPLPKRPDVLRVAVVTWNMNYRRELGSLAPLVAPALQGDADFVLIATQEGALSRAVLEPALDAALGREYMTLHTIALMGLKLFVCLKRALLCFVGRVESARLPTKMAGLIATKGAVGVSVEFDGTMLLFVNTHFTAHQGNVRSRNDDFRVVCRSLDLPKQQQQQQSGPPGTPMGGAAAGGGSGAGGFFFSGAATPSGSGAVPSSPRFMARPRGACVGGACYHFFPCAWNQPCRTAAGTCRSRLT